MSQTKKPLSGLGPRICAAIVKAGHVAEWNEAESSISVDGVALVVKREWAATIICHDGSHTYERWYSKAKRLTAAHVQPILDMVPQVKAREERAAKLSATKAAANAIEDQFSRDGVVVSAYATGALHDSSGPVDKIQVTVEFESLTVEKAQAVMAAMQLAMEDV